MSAGCGVGGPERLRTEQPGPGLEQPLTVVEELPLPPPDGNSVSSQSSRCRLWNSLCPPENKKHNSVVITKN